MKKSTVVAALCLMAASATGSLAVAQQASTEQILAYLDKDGDGKVGLQDYLQEQLPKLAEFDADRLIVLTTAPVLDADEVRLSVLAAESVLAAAPLLATAPLLAAAPLLATAPLLAAAPVLGEAAPVGEVVSTCRLRQKKKSC